MSTPAPNKKTPTRSRTKKPISRKRTSKSGIAVDQTDETPQGTVKKSAHNLPSRQPEQLIILVAAIVFGLLSLIIHILVVVSIVLMALLLGLIASEARSQRGRGIASEMVNEAKVVFEEIMKPGHLDTDDSAERSETTSGTTV
jgi:Flp pilus assembly protein TadB